MAQRDQGDLVLIHLASGKTVETLVENCETADDLRAIIEGQPRWQTIGDGAVVYTQAVSALELG